MKKIKRNKKGDITKKNNNNNKITDRRKRVAVILKSTKIKIPCQNDKTMIKEKTNEKILKNFYFS